MTVGFRDSRYIIGIDLGTTNSVVSFVDRYAKERSIENFPVLQVIASGELDKQTSLPSFCYLPLAHELEGDQLSLPWKNKSKKSVGVFARNHGSGIPERFISSAKSWLSHKGVNRTAGILPWGSEIATEDKLSPVETSRLILEHVRLAWNNEFGKKKDKDGTKCTLEESQVVVTVPASFDETARELTVKAAKDAGYEHLILLEEPLAAFYAWLDKTENWQELISTGEKILIVDIGGGTTDFSLIEFTEDENLRRTAVGNHLLLGGDNIDMTLARVVESQIKKKLSPRERSILNQRCRLAKEELLIPNGKEEVTVAVTTSGSSLVGNTVTGKLTKENVLKVIMEGFYPMIETTAALPEKKAGIRDLGLPYEKDPSVSAHLLSFLCKASGSDQPIIPDKILFNGGSMIPDLLRQRIIDLVNSWSENTVTELPAWDLDKAVSTGASYYGLVKAGEGVRVQGGIARSYFLEIETSEGPKLVCVMPRDTNEGDLQALSSMRFEAAANEPLKFPVHSSATRLHDQLGDIVDDREEVSELPPLITTLKFGKKNQKIEVELSTLLNETGTLEIHLNSVNTDHRWPLKFDMRALHDQKDTSTTVSELLPNTNQVAVTAEQINQAESAIDAVFNGSDKPGKLLKKLEDIFEINRNEWSLQLIRQLADYLLKLNPQSFKSAPLEARWMNLTGFCLRPGFGDTSDELRQKKLWSLWFGGPKFKTDAQVNAEWWVLWRRISGGINAGRQEQVAHALLKMLVPNDSYKKNTKYGAQEKMECWRCLGSLERTPVKIKKRIVDIQSARVSKLEDFELWAMARLLSRKLFYAPVDLTMSSKDASSFIKLLMITNKEKLGNMTTFALSRMATMTGESYLDINEKLRTELVTFLKSHDCQDALIRHIEEVIESSREESNQILGDTLPLGLTLKN
ncbi:MAG: hsp70 family protein [Lentisphaeraceae bacterium]|nr:hsp70 family protein [Lentisphaeraceae bacterium]